MQNYGSMHFRKIKNLIQLKSKNILSKDATTSLFNYEVTNYKEVT